MSGKVPFTHEELDADLQQMVAVMAGIVAPLFHFDDDMVNKFLGVNISTDDWIPTFYVDGIPDEKIKQIPLERHYVTRIVRRAYAYAYQLDTAEDETSLEELWYEVAPAYEQLPARDINGLPTPMNYADGRIRTVLETFEARYRLNNGDDLTIEDLALLADMAPATVRTSLSKEGFRLFDPTPTDPDVIIFDASIPGTTQPRVGRQGPKRNMLSNADAQDWLSRRRGFIPNRQPGTGVDWKTVAKNAFSEEVANFSVVLKRICNLAGMDVSAIAEATEKDRAWAEGLLNGEQVDIDINALVRLAKTLHVEPARFTSQAVAYLLRNA